MDRNRKKYISALVRIYKLIDKSVDSDEAWGFIIELINALQMQHKQDIPVCDDKQSECQAKDPSKCPIHGNAGNNAESKSKEKKPIDKLEKKSRIKLTGKQKIIANAFKNAKKEPPNYFELSGRSSAFRPNWKATKFSHSSTSKDHNNRHGKGVGAKDEADYVAKAKSFLHSPLGETGDVFVGTDEKIYKYDYKTKYLAIAYKDGTIGTYWNIGADRGLKGADKWWEDKKNTYKEN